MPSSTTTNYQFDRMMNTTLKATAYTTNATLYVSMFTTTPALTGTGGVEVSTVGTNYGRQPITSTTGWSGPSGTNREYSNAADIAFGVPTANWGTINSCGLWDAETGGNLMAIFTQATPKVVNNGDGAPRILAGQLRCSRSTC